MYMQNYPAVRVYCYGICVTVCRAAVYYIKKFSSELQAEIDNEAK